VGSRCLIPLARLLWLTAGAHRAGALGPWLRHDEELGYGRLKRIGQSFERLDRRILPTALDTPDIARLEAGQETERLLCQLFGHALAAQIPGHKGTHSHRARERTSCPRLIQALKVVLFDMDLPPSHSGRRRDFRGDQRMAPDQSSRGKAEVQRTSSIYGMRRPARTTARRIGGIVGSCIVSSVMLAGCAQDVGCSDSTVQTALGRALDKIYAQTRTLYKVEITIKDIISIASSTQRASCKVMFHYDIEGFGQSLSDDVTASYTAELSEKGNVLVTVLQ